MTSGFLLTAGLMFSPTVLPVTVITSSIQQVLLIQLIHDRVYAAGLVQVFHVGRACRRQMAEVRGPCADFIGDVHIQVHTGLMGDGRQMQHTVGGASKGHIYGQGIHECFFRS